MSTWLSWLNGLAVSLFGSILAAAFCGALTTPGRRWIFGGGMVALPLLYALAGTLADADLLRRIYPLLVHLPLLLLLWGLTRKRWLPVFSVLAAYLCCQLRRWIALLVTAVLGGGAAVQDAAELVITLPLLLLFLRFAAPAVGRLGDSPLKKQFQYSVIPGVYYVFDYVTVVYTDLLHSGSPVVLEFMPFVCCSAYLAFLLYNSAVERKQNQMQQRSQSLDLQIRQSVREIQALRESQTLTRQYRHDMRHHLQYIASCIENGQGSQAQRYISGICQEIEAQKVQHYCENEAANLILSSFAGRAEKDGVAFCVQGALPASLGIKDSDLCVILSNALENAVNACRPLAAEDGDCTVDVQFYEREGKLFLQVTNPCGGDIAFENGLPVSRRANHGVGVQSICAIVERYGGVHSFLVKDGRFILRLSV